MTNQPSYDSPLDCPNRLAFNDRQLIDRVVRCIQLDQECDYLTALEKLHEGAPGAQNLGNDGTLRGAVRHAGSDPDGVDATITLLDKRDEVVRLAYG